MSRLRLHRPCRDLRQNPFSIPFDQRRRGRRDRVIQQSFVMNQIITGIDSPLQVEQHVGVGW